MKKITFTLSLIAFLVITISMITKNHVNTSNQKSSEIVVKNEVMLEERR